MISLVMPTYHEALVIEDSLRRACAALAQSGNDFEIIVVDDSSRDGTAEIAEWLGRELPVRVLRRPGRLGLASAVVDGWSIARGDLLGVMDADLQHPPEVLGGLAAAFKSPAVDLVIASRYTKGGGTSRWPWHRKLNSWAATHLAASVLPWTLASVTDPMSGMFLVRASILKGVHLNPVGYKILLEVLAKAQYREMVEVPYVFEQRGRGASKAAARQGLEYLVHLGRLARSTDQLAAWIRYGAVGLSGGIVDIAALCLTVERAEWPLAAALPLAIQLALLGNFFLNNILTFQNARDSAFVRFLRYEAVCIPGAILNALTTYALVIHGNALLPAAVAGVLAGGAWNFLFNVPAIWRAWGSRSSPTRSQPP